MKPYLEPNPTLAFFIEWGIMVASILLVFSPFIYLGFKKWKRKLTITWWDIFGSYFFSFLIYYVWDWVILNKLDRFIYNNYINTGWLQDAIGDPGFRMIFIVVVTWPLLVFYCTRLIRNKFTKINLLISLGISTLFFISLILIWLYVMAAVLVQIGNTYF